VIKLAFIGAGSVEFTRNVTTDLCSYPEFRSGLHFALYDISAERLAHAERLVRRISAQTGAEATVSVTQDRRTALAGATYVINEVQVGGYQGRLRHSRQVRAAPDDRRHPRHRRHLPRPAHHPRRARPCA
jgi:alpha-galactosidase/6-phospho-beta-glucosidase family protein